MKKEDLKVKKLAVFVIVTMILCMSIILVAVIDVIYINKYNVPYIPKLNQGYDIINFDERKFQEMIINDENKDINQMCNKGCNIYIEKNQKKFYYMLDYTNKHYYLTVVRNSTTLIREKDLGISIENAYITNYLDNILLFNIIKDGNYVYDYALVANDKKKIDEFSSLEVNEMEFTNDGIVYYYEVCQKNEDKNAKKIKAIRKPFSTEPKLLSSEFANYDWCE